METLKNICLTVVQFVKQVGMLPQTIANAITKKRQRTVLDEVAAERLDRLRNPSKYVGK